MTEAELVFSHILNCDRLSLYLNKDTDLNQDQCALVSQIFKRRISGEPLQYILGEAEFMGLKFKVDKRALIPRPETEILVEAALEELGQMSIANPKVLDLGTGSGCIAVAMAKLFPQASIWATDISQEALQLAKENAALNNVEIKFLRCDLFSGLEKEKFDLMISNPPYIATQEFCRLARELSFEPKLALEAGTDGLDFYRRIIKQAGVYLNPAGLIAFEVGINQADAVKDILLKEKFDVIKIIKDYNNIKRVVIAKKRITPNG